MNAPAMKVPAQQMLDLLEELAVFSAPGPGVSRLLYTPEWLKAQRFLQERMAALGMKVRTDGVGNVYGRITGSQPAAKVILTGSHMDTVLNGGKYDGAYGIAAAVTALHYLRQHFGQPLRTVEAVAFCEEEGSRFPLAYWGSGNVTGLYDGSEADSCADSAGVTIASAMAACGLAGGPEDRGSAAVADSAGRDIPLREDIGAFVELHIEQGIVLEQAGLEIGIVEAIAGQRRYSVKVAGSTNHAGTTPMGLRRDALAGAAELLLAMEQAAAAAGDPLVATCGKLEAVPGTPNVIPGEVEFTLDIRHSEAVALEHFCSRLLAAFEGIAAKRGLTLQFTVNLATSPAPMNTGLNQQLEHIARQQGRSFRSMVSGAGHDAQLFAPVCPTSMIFVPSRAGISHSPEEYSSPDELAAGLNLLTAILYELAYKES
ncbi:allantoate amidohydrolase [Paenibacillus sp. FSL R7-0273]|uniref:Zn-dependent hydrolase n=1 Tax=Paenibacillus sp. FSL R7-0273 TaxID=1536772 RepID=UPI0004F62D2C|nr:Zn-dependent hydrolase [Paenibacillus sp. FSL R7-0273]AIQ45664.1 allantoate amidohydrolase [Paenibacillus sp. FSL R7-0273]OMF95186.1 allantoate amidohydrolase [Paenibacillus sp. FSL R7-0273]